MSWFNIFIPVTLLSVMCAVASVPALCQPDQVSVLTQAPVSGVRDYGILFWHDGIRGADSLGRRLLCVQTGTYGAVFDVTTARLVQLGPIENAPDYSTAAAEYNRRIDSMPAASSDWTIRANGKTYRCIRGAESWIVTPMKPGSWVKNPEPGLMDQNALANKKTNCRLLDYGQFRQAFEIDRLVFQTDDGERLNAVVRLGVTSWPDSLSLKLECIPDVKMTDAVAEVSVAASSGTKSATSVAATWPAGTVQRVSLRIPFAVDDDPEPGGVTIEAVDTATDEKLTSSYHALEDMWKVQLNNHPRPKGVVNGLDRYTLHMKNTSDQSRKIRVVFALEKGWDDLGLPSDQRGQKSIFSPMGGQLILRDRQGRPSGMHLQSSHNWVPEKSARKNTPDLLPWIDTDPVEYGAWSRYATVVELPPHSEWNGEAVYSQALWGGVPQASYYFLSLYGWGFYTFWDVAIQGSFGESTCYSIESFAAPDIADLRPLYVTSYDSWRKPAYEWTPNLGGANYLHYKTDGRKQYLNTRRVMSESGPCLTHTEFHGRTQDGSIAFKIVTEHPRTDDINRSYQHIHYDVLADTDVDQLAFFQLGTSAYDFLQPGAIAWGDRSGLQEEVVFQASGPPLGEVGYVHKGIQLTGSAPWWISQHQASASDVRGDQGQLGLASRGLVVREWNAVLNGQRVEHPFISLFGTHHRAPGMLAEIGGPNGLMHLKHGDFIEMRIETLLVPKYSEHYLGTNEALKQSLPATADTWAAVFRQATGNDLVIQVLCGALEQTVPPVLHVDESGAAEFEVSGGLAYVPFTFIGVQNPGDCAIYEVTGGVRRKVDQSDHGLDFWQAVYNPISQLYHITFNLGLDTPNDAKTLRRFRFESKQRKFQ